MITDCNVATEGALNFPLNDQGNLLHNNYLQKNSSFCQSRILNSLFNKTSSYNCKMMDVHQVYNYRIIQTSITAS